MTEQPPSQPTVDQAPPADGLDAGLAASSGPDSGPPLPAHGCGVEAFAAPPILLRETQGEENEPILKPHSDAVPIDSALGFRIDGEIAWGGMGAVLKGRDTNLGRDIAVKVLLETHQGKTELVQRFVEEAQIAGQLQHPGIPPVYRLGQFADKRPYFTMKLVKGKTLAALLAARTDLAAERTQLIGIFGQVCQTLAYAHARGVIHRDLKPANIMVGSFGEVQVMDWGLAKVLHQGGVANAQQAQTQQAVSVIRTQRAETGSDTQAGSVLGTPAYMAPEQARGEVDLVDERADAFGLGAILCEVLTGQPPFTGKKPEAMRKAQTAQVDDALGRLDGCGADGELTGLAKQCLAAEPWDRPRNASVVAEAVAAYQNSVTERLRQAELVHAAEAARNQEAEATAAQERKAREAAQARAVAERQARLLTLGLAASVLALVMVGAACGLWLQHQQAERKAEAVRKREAVETALEKVRELRQQARWAEARAVLQQTGNVLGEAAPEDLRQRVQKATAELALVDRLEDIRLKRSTIVAGKFDNRTADLDYAETFREAGLGEEGKDPEKVAARIRDSAVGEHLVAALDVWAIVTSDMNRREWLLEVARRADPDPWRDRFRDSKVWHNRVGFQTLAQELLNNQAQLKKQKPQLLAALASALAWTETDPIPLLAAAQAHYPDDFWLNFGLANAFLLEKKWDEAIGYYRAALAVRPSAAVVRNNLGKVLVENKRVDEGIQELRSAIQLQPGFAQAHNGLGAALIHKNELDQAIKELRIAIQLGPKFASPHSNLGNALKGKKHLEEALQEHRLAIRLDPRDALAHYNLGTHLLDQKEMDEAIKEFRLAIHLDPKFTQAHSNLGNALKEKQQLDEAIAEFRLAIHLEPKFAKAHYNLGNTLYAKKQRDEAIAEFRLAIHFEPKDAMAHNNLGKALLDKNQVDEAIREFRLAIHFDPIISPAHNNLGRALMDKKEPDEAIKEFRLAIQLDPNLAMAHNNLGSALHGRKKVDEAIQEYRLAIQLEPKLAMAHYNLGTGLSDKNQLDEAIQELRLAIQLDSKLALAHFTLGLALAKKKQPDEAIQEYRLAIQLDPKAAQPHGALGQALMQSGRFAEARESTLQCRKLLSQGDPIWQLVTQQLQDCEQLLALDQKVLAILQGKGKPANDAERLQLAQFCLQPFKKFYGASMRFFSEAFANDSGLVDDMKNQHRYNAACVAELAGSGHGNDAAKVDDQERTRLRKQAVAWLRADLDYWSRQAGSPRPGDRDLVRKALQHWHEDPDLAELREKDALKNLPTKECEACQKLWADVDALLQKIKAEK